MGVKGKFSSLTSFVTNPLLNVTIMTLIVVGGIGFFTWLDIRENKWHITKYRLQSKVVLGVSTFLIFAPAVLFFFLFPKNKRWLLSYGLLCIQNLLHHCL